MSYADTRTRPPCLECEAPEDRTDPPADRMVVDANGDPFPLCGEHADRRVEQGGLEYPLTEFTDTDPRTSEHFTTASIMELFEVDNYEESRIEAKNPPGADPFHGFVNLADIR